MKNLVVNLPKQPSHQTGWRKNLNWLSGFILRVKLSGQSIRLDITGTWTIGNGEVKSAKKQWPAILMGIKSFSILNIRKRFLWSVHTINGCLASSSQCLHSSNTSFMARSSVTNIIILLSRRHSSGEKAHGWSLPSVSDLWDNTPPTPEAEASTSRRNCWAEFSWERMGAEVNLSLKCLKAWAVSEDQRKGS